MTINNRQLKRPISRRHFLQLSATAGVGMIGLISIPTPKSIKATRALAGTIPNPQ